MMKIMSFYVEITDVTIAYILVTVNWIWKYFIKKAGMFHILL